MRAVILLTAVLGIAGCTYVKDPADVEIVLKDHSIVAKCKPKKHAVFSVENDSGGLRVTSNITCAPDEQPAEQEIK